MFNNKKTNFKFDNFRLKLKKYNVKTKWLILIANILLVIYIIVIGSIGIINNWKANLVGNQVEMIVILIVMFIFELLSTLTFQTRIWLTSKEKITFAAFVGAISWMIAGFQGLLLINGSINGLSDVATFFVKMPSVLTATFVGILTNDIISKKTKLN